VVLTLAAAAWSVADGPSPSPSPGPVAVGTDTLAPTNSPSSASATLVPSPRSPPLSPLPPLPTNATASTWKIDASYRAVLGTTVMACPSASTCYMAGVDSADDGDVVASTNAGSTWHVEALPTGVGEVTGLACPSLSRCYATEDNAVMVTDDDGSLWTVHTVPSGRILTGIGCASDTTCVAVGDDGGQPDLFDTSDAGAHWAAYALPPDLDSLGTDIEKADVACPSTTVCYVVTDGEFLTTTDAGRTWRTQQDDLTAGMGSQFSGELLSCPTTKVCIIEGGIEHGTQVQVGIFVTSDSGSNWSFEPIRGYPGGPGIAGVSCPSTKECVVTGFTGKGPKGYALIFVTTDAGRTWRTTARSAASVGFGAIACPTTVECVTGEDGLIDAGVLVTTNAGRTWALRALPASVGGVFGLACPSVADCYATTGTGVLATSDTGAHWHLQDLPPLHNGAASISCPSVTVCFTLDTFELVGTSDAGARWTVRSALPTDTYPMALACPSVTTCYVVGDEIDRTTDGGATWQTQTGTNDRFTAVACATVSTCFAGAEGGEIYATTDGGATWVAQATPTGTKPTVTGISCSSATSCVAVAQDFNCFDEGDDPCPAGTVAVVSTDDGSHWSGSTVPADINLDSVACPPDGTCVAVGYDGVQNGYLGGGGGSLLTSSDHGVSWVLGTLPADTGALSDVSCPSANRCYAVGVGTGNVGALILTTNDP
jgi:photosystem II stability/assembly factor-like uncharacterized protein